MTLGCRSELVKDGIYVQQVLPQSNEVLRTEGRELN